MSVFGIDVSEWQGNFDFNRAKAEGVKFAIIRAAYNRTKDICFEDNYFKAKAEGLNVGAYLYAMDKTPEDAEETAKWLIRECLQGKQFDYPIYYDIEDTSFVTPLNRELITDIIKAFCITMENAGYFVGIYASVWVYDNCMNDTELKRFTHWVARWNINPPILASGNNAPLWQFGGEVNKIRDTKIAGQTCDQNYSYQDFPTVIIENKLNGYGEQTAPEKPYIIKGSKVIVTEPINYNGKPFRLFYPVYDVLEVINDRVVIGIGNSITAAININNLKLVQ